MTKQEIVKEDGRRLVYYSFGRRMGERESARMGDRASGRMEELKNGRNCEDDKD
jgi:hypothetical protein